MKEKIYGLIKLIVFLVILFICLNITHNITKRKDSYVRRIDFNSQKENFDVLFFGSSHMKDTIHPMELWRDYGIVSYNLGTASERIPLSYWSMRLALKDTKPKLVVLDALFILDNDKYDVNNKTIHLSLDSYPSSFTKLKAIKDIFGAEHLLENVINYTFEFANYHSRWDELKKNDFIAAIFNYGKGADFNINLEIPIKVNDFENVKIYNGEESIGVKYLKMFIEYCENQNIEVLITYLPFPANDDCISISKYIGTICEQYDVRYINFLENAEEIINYDTDCADANSHLNPSGAKKVTKVLGKYIVENYNIPNQKNNEKYTFWEQDFNEYIYYKINLLKNNKKILQNYLMLLYDQDFYYEIKIKSTVEIETDEILKALLDNLNNNYEINDEIFKGNDRNIKITVYDKRNNKIIDETYFKY